MGFQQSKPLNEIPKIADEQLLIARDQARIMLGGVSYVTICRWEEQGKLIPVKMSEGASAKVFYMREDILAFVASRRRPATTK
jgi:hypothetical protein